MQDWWLVRRAEYMGWLTSEEWRHLTSEAKKWSLLPGQSLIWGPNSKVVLLERGAVSVTCTVRRRSRLINLHVGDLVGTLPPAVAILQPCTTATFFSFEHKEWLETLGRIPQVTEKLLRGMAWHALWQEQGVNQQP